MQKFLLICFALYILFRLFRGNFVVFRFNGQNQRSYNPYHDKQKQEGEITIENPSNKTIDKNKDEGDYVEYEEVK